MSEQKTGSLIAVAFPTIMSGLVVRWYADMAAYEAGREMGSASREQAMIYTDSDPEFAGLAQEVHHRIKRHGHNADLSDVLTHRCPYLSARDLTPISAPPAVPADGAGETRAGR